MPLIIIQNFPTHSDLLMNLELGTKPGKPDAVSGSISGGNLTITATVNDTTISFIPTITYPLNGPAPYLAIIAFGSLTILALSGVAIITYNNDEIGAQIN
ncbi:hypothetical protein D6D22_09367 [Aureobasidium pullulans]|uniref:(4-O-methyl)-D-glucuronate--lignin esterase n=1 Tax=Aureobasidium pullulans TaxID=5580 RepID=A0A4S8X618_AURPU|nr:hypothetical protein D6D22_09367 [Aureobasidium pullulans]